MLKFEHQFSRKEQWLKLALLFPLLLAICLPLLLQPEQLPLPDCYFKNITGIDCPTCGITRGYFAVSHGDLQGALKLHLFSTLIYLAIWLLIGKLAAELISRRRIQINFPAGFLKMSGIVMFIVFLGHWIVKIVF